MIAYCYLLLRTHTLSISLIFRFVCATPEVTVRATSRWLEVLAVRSRTPKKFGFSHHVSNLLCHVPLLHWTRQFFDCPKNEIPPNYENLQKFITTEGI